MKTLASRIQHELQVGEWKHCAVYENELQRIWPLDEKDRKAKIAQFAKEGGFCLSFYKKGLCAIFENNPMVAKWMRPPVVRIQDRKDGGYDVRSMLYRIEIALATARRWQTIAKLRWQMVAKLPAAPLLRVASQTTMAFSHCYTSLESFLKAKWQMIRPSKTRTISTHIYEIRPRADKRGVDLISDALPFSPVWYAGPNAISNAVRYAKFRSRSHDAVVRVYDEAGNVIERHAQAAGDFREP
jgi:hypothetical protein